MSEYKVPADQIERWSEALKNPKTFAETFLYNPEDHTPFKAQYPQIQTMTSIGKNNWFCIHRRGGKALALDALVYTPTGPITMREVKVGTIVSTPDGGSAPVTEIFPFSDIDLYRLHFENGYYVDCCLDHLWKIRINDLWEIVSTLQLIDYLVTGKAITVPGVSLYDELYSVNRKLLRYEYIGKGDAQCITVDHPEHLFITNGGIVTHNCVHGSTLVVNPLNLRPTRIDELKSGMTPVFDFKKNKTVWSGAEWVESGTKKCLKFKFESGATLSLSTDHQLFSRKRGWIQAKDLFEGDEILAPSKLNIFGTDSPEESTIEFVVDQTLAFKEIPDPVFKYNEFSLKLFIRKMFSAVGRIQKDQKYASFMISNKKMALDLRHLLLRLEVESVIDENGNIFVENEIDINLLLSYCGVYTIITDVKSPRRWEKIIFKDDIGVHLVYDLCVEHDDHNFIANDIVVHNSYSMTLIAFWHAIRNKNQNIYLFAPSAKQVNAFFEVLRAWIDEPRNEILHLMKSREGDTQDPQKITFTNGSKIEGFILNGSGNVRGLTANVVFVDEAQDLTDQHWAAIKPIMMGDKRRRQQGKIVSYVAGTLVGPSGQFYHRVEISGGDEKNRVIKIPIDKNPEWTPEELEELKIEVGNDREWEQEYLLNVTEANNSVFKRSEIEAACPQEEDYSYGPDNIIEGQYRFVTVDWDKVQCGTNILVSQYNKNTRKLTVIDHLEVPQSEYHYLDACRLIQQYYDVYRPELVICDSGAGATQLELLSQNAKKSGSGLADRLKAVVLASKIEVPSVQLDENPTEKKSLKPFLVDTLRNRFQDGLIKYAHSHSELTKQLYQYRVIRRTQTTTVYSSDNEHIIDCLLFAVYGLYLTFENPFENYESKAEFTMIPTNILHSNDDPERHMDSFWDNVQIGRTDLVGMDVYRSPLGGGFDRGDWF